MEADADLVKHHEEVSLVEGWNIDLNKTAELTKITRRPTVLTNLCLWDLTETGSTNKYHVGSRYRLPTYP